MSECEAYDRELPSTKSEIIYDIQKNQIKRLNHGLIHVVSYQCVECDNVLDPEKVVVSHPVVLVLSITKTTYAKLSYEVLFR